MKVENRRMRRQKLVAIPLSVVSLVMAPSFSLGNPGVPESVWEAKAKNNPLVKDWLRRLRDIEEMLHSLDAKTATRAERLSSHLYQAMLEQVVEGEGGCELFARVLFYRAVAEARLGDLDSAAWHWQEVQSLSPDLKDDMMAKYPDVTSRLKSWLVPYVDGLKSKEALDTVATGAARPTDSELELVTPPENIKKVHPEYPLALRYLHKQGVTRVEGIIDKKGIPRWPVTLQSCGVTGFDVASMEALRSWRYKPATRGGKPIAVYLTVTFSFSMAR